ncbi:hypothetical protein AbraIFM66951_000035 [Aspergillus brasiliensis]|uniref:Mediator of RNA polymerase II transcription subunit 9 n=1 Tax=Aspergillus brasiliensis TaxID=319629 RepID=A0A9W5YSN9_9EURO|nr:hypothetical protein AbraCBS73388_009474 [Aspergillus brasiliensis]GKZ40274.1 hypothetical protein AbraIFM66951_000035 [Aspergillus brasiliensis]
MASRSPTAVTPLPKSSVAPETPMVKDVPATPQAVPFPSPQTFDIVPPLHGLLSRLLSPSTNAAGGVRATDDPTGAAAPTGPPSGTPGQPQSQQQAATVTSAGPGGAEISGLGSSTSPALDIKDLPTEVSSIKIRIQKAQAVVENLPDVDRSVADQEKEIQELEDRIAKLKSVISDFGQMASPGGAKKLKSQGP